MKALISVAIDLGTDDVSLATIQTKVTQTMAMLCVMGDGAIVLCDDKGRTVGRCVVEG